MQRRFIQLALRARRLVRPVSDSSSPGARRPRLTGRRQVGLELTQFSFRLAFVIDVAYIGVGALGGAAIGRATALPHRSPEGVAVSCRGPVSAPQAATNATPGQNPSVICAAPANHSERLTLNHVR
jgi:hypothetical protein